MGEIKHDDYIGFTFNNKHSSEFGIVRVSDGSRFNEDLLPTIQDKTVQIPGGDGTYYFGSYYTQKQFSISYAFDSLTEAQLNDLKQWLGDKKIHSLVFDEIPYKVYQAKVTGSSSIKYIPFSEGATNRVYKGEGTIQFTAYDPFARSDKKYLNEYRKFREKNLTEKTYQKNMYYVYNQQKEAYIKSNEDYDATKQYYEDYSNTKEWENASGMLEFKDNYDVFDDGIINLYNPGVKETDFILSLKPITEVNGIIKIEIDGSLQGTIELDGIPSNKDDEIRINSRLNLIEGYSEGRKTGNVYNGYMKGSFFKIPVSTTTTNLQMFVPSGATGATIDYKYIYF